MQSKDKKKILVFIDWYLPGYKAGGPVRSMANISIWKQLIGGYMMDILKILYPSCR